MEEKTPGYNIRKMKEAFMEDLQELLDDFKDLSGLQITGINFITYKSFPTKKSYSNLLGVDVEEI